MRPPFQAPAAVPGPPPTTEAPPMRPPGRRHAAHVLTHRVRHGKKLTISNILDVYERAPDATVDREKETVAFRDGDPIPLAMILRHLRRQGALVTLDGATKYVIVRHPA